MEYRKITHEEFMNLKYGEIVYLKVGDIFIDRIVYKTPFFDENKKEFVLKTFKPRTNYLEREIYIKVGEN